jgi:hypothetical protein
MQNDTLFREDIIHLAEDLIYQLMCDSASDQGITFYALYHLIGISGVLLDIVYDPTFGNISEYYFIQHIDKGFGWFFQPPTYLEDIFVNNNTFPNMQLTYDIVFVNYMNLHILMIPPNVLRVVSIVLYDYAQFYMFSDS